MEKKTIKKNDIYTIEIEDLSTDGSGIGKVDGYTLFVKDALIGDTAEVKVIKTKKHYGYGRLMRIITPSPDRVEAPCPHARSCGGCQIQHLSYERQLAFKENKVRNLLSRVGHVEDYVMHPIIGMEHPYYYRNKAQFPVGLGKDGQIVTGFYAGHTHVIVDSAHCCIQAPVNEQLLVIVKKWMTDHDIAPYDETTHKGLVRHILTRVGFKTKEIMVCLIINGKKLPHSESLVEALREIPGMTSISFNINQEKTNVILGSKVVTLWGQDYITDYIGDVRYQISPLSFYQVNPVQTEKLYGAALKFANPGPNDVIWDLYCGIGTISLFMAKKAKQVYGVETVPQAIDDAKRNAAINDIHIMLNFMWERQKKCCRRLMNVSISMQTSSWWTRRERAVTRACWHVSHRCSQSGWSMSAAIRPHWPEILDIWKHMIIRLEKFSALICSGTRFM